MNAAFERHAEECDMCRNHPFAPCDTGGELLRIYALELANGTHSRPAEAVEACKTEFRELLESAFQRAWTLGLDHKMVAPIVEDVLRKKYFKANVLP